ncbi:MAG: DUF1566 domain-containing protein [Pseudomonadota bacterium]
MSEKSEPAPEPITKGKRQRQVEQAQTETKPPEAEPPVPESAPVVEKSQSDTEGLSQKGYVKIGHSGDRMGDDAEHWACVEDTATGLVWEVKSADNGLHHADGLYSWYQPEEDGEHEGVGDAGRCDGDSECDTRAYVQALNEENYCGFTDWRLPTREELLSLVKIGETAAAAIDLDYFPQALPSWYWTATSNAEYPDHAWYVLFRNGVALSDRKSRPKHLRLVRSDRPAG